MNSDVEKILEERAKTHGRYDDFAKFVQELKRFVDNSLVNALTDIQRESIDMIIHKLGRIVTGNPNVKDHWDDLAGYATLAAKSLDHDRSIREGKTQEPSKKQVGQGIGETEVFPEDSSIIQKIISKTSPRRY